jgi:hypothetical protein
VRNQASRTRARYVLEVRLSALSVSQLGLVEQPKSSGAKERDIDGAEESRRWMISRTSSGGRGNDIVWQVEVEVLPAPFPVKVGVCASMSETEDRCTTFDGYHKALKLRPFGGGLGSIPGVHMILKTQVASINASSDWAVLDVLQRRVQLTRQC